MLATASSDAVLPQIMRKLERMGVKPSVVGLVVPTGYSFNLDAFSIYLTLATVFIAQATNTPLSFGDLLLVLGISLVTSKGAHGVPGSAIVILAATLNAVPAIPAIGLVLVLSVDWFIGMARALGNLIGNCVATVVIGAWEKDLDVDGKQVLAGDVMVDIIDAPVRRGSRRNNRPASAVGAVTRPPGPLRTGGCSTAMTGLGAVLIIVILLLILSVAWRGISARRHLPSRPPSRAIAARACIAHPVGGAPGYRRSAHHHPTARHPGDAQQRRRGGEGQRGAVVPRGRPERTVVAVRTGRTPWSRPPRPACATPSARANSTACCATACRSMPGC